MKRYLLCRIIGNDIPPRHSPRQSFENLKFICANEAEFAECDKCFIFNRVIDADRLEAMCEWTKEAGHRYEVIPYVPNEFRACVNDPQRRHYLTNINAARNFAIHLGESHKYVLPLDGGCFFHPSGWAGLDTQVRINPGRAFFVVPMCRASCYAEVMAEKPERRIRETYRMGEVEMHGATEPQLMFGRGMDILFDIGRAYGSCDKAEVLWRLGVPGVWDNWGVKDKRLVLKYRGASVHSGTGIQAGWCFRLPSGNPVADADNLSRSEARREGVRRLVEVARACNG